jgi:hypothetical protein
VTATPPVVVAEIVTASESISPSVKPNPVARVAEANVKTVELEPALLGLLSRIKDWPTDEP